MSVYSKCVDARGTITMVSTPAFFQPSYPLFSSRLGSGAFFGDCGVDDPFSPGLAKYGATLNPYSDCTPSAGTTGSSGPCASNSSPPRMLAADESLSRATTADTRLSTACT